jgi:hypothetical protein
MKRWPIITASIGGAIVGLLSAIYLATAVGMATPLTTTATLILVIICPVIYSIWWGWWLVPLLNAMLCGGLAFAIAKWRLSHRHPDYVPK